MKRKYPKTKGMASIFEKRRFNQEMASSVFREIHRRWRNGEKVTAIVQDLLKSETYGWKMTHKDEESWRTNYYEFRRKHCKSVRIVKYEKTPINIG